MSTEPAAAHVHRFTGHAIRLNLAYSKTDVVRGAGKDNGDPWQAMFDAARAEAAVDSDLIPYWIYEGPVKVERRVPTLPFSREARRLEWIKTELNPVSPGIWPARQEDLLEYLHPLLGPDLSADDLAELQIQLQP